MTSETDRADFTIRPATADDDPALVILQQESAIHHASIDPDRWRIQTPEEVRASRRLWHTARPRDGAFVAVANGAIIGMIELWLKRPRDPSSARTPRVEADLGIAVTSGWRGKGVGTALLRAAEDWARVQGAERMVLDLDANNTGALRLYQRLGYVVHGLEMDKPIEPSEGPAERSDALRNVDGIPIPTLRGETVTLRAMRQDDRPALLEVLRDPSVVAVWDTRGADNSADELLAGDEGWTVWAIEVDGEFAGSIQAAEEQDPAYRHAGIDIFMHSRFQGRGLGTDAVRTLARYLLEVRGHHRLTIDPAADNERAIRSYEKVGFKPVGVMRRYERGVAGTFHDGLLMDLLAGELR